MTKSLHFVVELLFVFALSHVVTATRTRDIIPSDNDITECRNSFNVYANQISKSINTVVSNFQTYSKPGSNGRCVKYMAEKGISNNVDGCPWDNVFNKQSVCNTISDKCECYNTNDDLPMLRASDFLCHTRTIGGACMVTGATPSCSCQGRCIRAYFMDHETRYNTQSIPLIDPNYPFDYDNYPANNYHHYSPHPDYLASTPERTGYWATCACGDEYYGERCEYKKEKDDILNIVAGNIPIDRFPFLPWYMTDGERDLWIRWQRSVIMVPESNSPADTNFQLTYDAASATKSLAARGADSKMIWAWQGLKHSCPYGMIALEMYDNQALGVRTAYTRNRAQILCQCDPQQGKAGCNYNGECKLYTLGQDGISLDSKGQCSKVEATPHYNALYPSFQWNYLSTQPKQWSRCLWFPGFYCVYCVIYESKKVMCGGFGTPIPEVHATSVTPAQRWNEAGECFCKEETARPALIDPSRFPVTQRSDNKLLPPASILTKARYKGQGGNGKPTRLKNLCIEDKSKSKGTKGCNGKGIYNNAGCDGGSIESGCEKERIFGCECFLAKPDGTDYTTDQVVDMITNHNLNGDVEKMKLLRGGPNCLGWCSQEKCNNNGICQFKLRSLYIQDLKKNNPYVKIAFPYHLPDTTPLTYLNMPLGGNEFFAVDWKSPGFWPTEDSDYDPQTVFPYIVSDKCYCDPTKWRGDSCNINVNQGAQCDGWAKNPSNEVCKDNCISGSTYDPVSFRCLGNCPKWTERHPNDPTNDAINNLECGGPERGTCTDTLKTGSDGKTYKTCACKNGYASPETGCSLPVCPRVRGKTCNGHGQCYRHDNWHPSVWRCLCDKGWMGSACETMIPQPSDTCRRSTQVVNNRDRDWIAF